ncbi:MAG: prolipoprotein diacylglyceryl transferase [Chitinophagales bacterium]
MYLFLRAYATIPDFINDILGTEIARYPINTYGFFVAMGFFVAAIAANIELKRRGELGLLPSKKATVIEGVKVKWTDLISPFIVWFLFGFKLLGAVIFDVDLLRQGQDSVAYILSLQGFWGVGILTGLLAAGYTYYSIKKKELTPPVSKQITVGPEESIGELVIVAAIFGIMGSSIFEIIQPNSTMTFVELFSDPMNFISGLTIFGGLFFGIIGIFIYSKWRKIKPFQLFDSLAPGFILANGVGRLGCHFSGDGDWGKANLSEAPSWIPDYFWSNNYAHNVLDACTTYVSKNVATVESSACARIAECEGLYCHELATGVWPTSIYEFVMLVVLFFVLWAVRKKFTAAPGFIFAFFFVLAGLERFPIEYLRVTDTYPAFFNFTQAQIISIVMILGGLVGMGFLYAKHKDAIQRSSFKATKL